jgi:hypothetical protein
MKQAENFDPEDGGDMFLRNGGRLSSDYTAFYTIKTFIVIAARKSTPTYLHLFVASITKLSVSQTIRRHING